MENVRQGWVDIAKALAIIAVVLGHITFQYPKIALLPISADIASLYSFYIVAQCAA